MFITDDPIFSQAAPESQAPAQIQLTRDNFADEAEPLGAP